MGQAPRFSSAVYFSREERPQVYMVDEAAR